MTTLFSYLMKLLLSRDGLGHRVLSYFTGRWELEKGHIQATTGADGAAREPAELLMMTWSFARERRAEGVTGKRTGNDLVSSVPSLARSWAEHQQLMVCVGSRGFCLEAWWGPRPGILGHGVPIAWKFDGCNWFLFWIWTHRHPRVLTGLRYTNSTHIWEEDHMNREKEDEKMDLKE